jgi:tetratricopeptide (TPR) repeat protein
VCVLRRKYGRLRKKANVVVFPGTFEKLVEKGFVSVEQGKFEQAVEAFDQAIVYEPDHPEFLGPYAVALYETKDFDRAKEIAAKLLHSGTTDYIDAMELYLTISIQLQEYDEVEMTIGTLIEEGVVPDDMLNKFNYLRELNGRLSERYVHDDLKVRTKPFTIEEFMKLDTLSQQYALASLEGTDLSGMNALLKEIAELSDVSPLIITFALTLLHQVGYSEVVTVQKFNRKMAVIPSSMTMPGQDKLTLEVVDAIEQLLFKEPSRLEMAKSLIEKFTITSFPFSWGDHEAEEVAEAYVNYIECLFTGDRLPETELNLLIQQIDNDSDLL